MTGIQSSEEAKLITQYLIQKLKETNIYLYTSLNQIQKLQYQEYAMYYNPKTTKYCYYRKNYISKMGINSILDNDEILELLGISQSDAQSSSPGLQQIEDKEKILNKINNWLSDNEIMAIHNKIAHKLAQLITLSNAKNTEIIKNMNKKENMNMIT